MIVFNNKTHFYIKISRVCISIYSSQPRNANMYMKYAKNKHFSKNTIQPDPNVWQHKPSPEIIEKCIAIADYPYISKKFAKKSDHIDYSVIDKYLKYFESYDDAIISGYLNERSPLYIPVIVDSRLYKEKISTEYSKLIQFFYEVQCALTEFYVYVNQFQYQFRKTLLLVMNKHTVKNTKPFMNDDLLKQYGNEHAYNVENASKLIVTYDLYLRISYGLKILLQYIYTTDKPVISKDIEEIWMMCGYSERMHKNSYNILSTASNRMFSNYSAKQNTFLPDVAENIYQALLGMGGTYQKEESGVITEYTFDRLFSPSEKYQQYLTNIFANERYPSRLLGSNAVLQLSSDFPNPMLVDSGIFSFELSVFSHRADHQKLIYELVMFGGIYNHVRDCVNYPLIFQFDDNTVNSTSDNSNYLQEFISSFVRTLMVKFDHILFENNSRAFESQVKKRMTAQLRN